MIKKLWIKLFKRKKEKPWKTDCYFGREGDERFRGHGTISGCKYIGDRIVEGEYYYLRDICGNVLINKDESGKNLI